MGAMGGEWSQYNRDATRSRGLSGSADLVVRPGSTAEVAAVMALCYELDVPLIPRGGGTGLAGGAVPLVWAEWHGLGGGGWCARWSGCARCANWSRRCGG